MKKVCAPCNQSLNDDLKPNNELEQLFKLFMNERGKFIWQTVHKFWFFFQIRKKIPFYPLLNDGKDDTKVIHYYEEIIEYLNKEMFRIFDEHPSLHFYGQKNDFNFVHVCNYPWVLISKNNIKLRNSFQNGLPYQE